MLRARLGVVKGRGEGTVVVLIDPRRLHNCRQRAPPEISFSFTLTDGIHSLIGSLLHLVFCYLTPYMLCSPRQHMQLGLFLSPSSQKSYLHASVHSLLRIVFPPPSTIRPSE